MSKHRPRKPDKPLRDGKRKPEVKSRNNKIRAARQAKRTIQGR